MSEFSTSGKLHVVEKVGNINEQTTPSLISTATIPDDLTM